MITADLEGRLRGAMEATGQEIAPGSIGAFTPGRRAARGTEPGRPVRFWRWQARLVVPLAAGAAVIAVVAAALALSSGPGRRAAGSSPAGSVASPTASPARPPTPSPAPGSPATAVASVQGATSISCNDATGDQAIIDAFSGNPVADCDSIWQQSYRAKPPQLTAYADDGGVYVLPVTAKPQAGSVPLPAGVVMNTRLIVLNEWLQDWVSGPMSHCYSGSQAVTAVQGELTSLGLPGWTAVTELPAASPPTACANTGQIFYAQHEVQLQSGPPEAAGGQLQSLASSLRQIIGQCDDLPVAAARVRTAAAQAGLPVSSSGSGTWLQQVTVPDARCTSIYLEVGGTVIVTVRGPAGPGA
jgi:hypothetical protein